MFTDEEIQVLLSALHRVRNGMAIEYSRRVRYDAFGALKRYREVVKVLNELEKKLSVMGVKPDELLTK